MTKLFHLEQLLSSNLISKQDQIALKGKGKKPKRDKNCPPPVEE